MNQRQPDQQLITEWSRSKGGEEAAALEIMTVLECSFSKAAKIAGGRYAHQLSAAEQKELSRLIEKPRDAIFKIRANGTRPKKKNAS